VLDGAASACWHNSLAQLFGGGAMPSSRVFSHAPLRLAPAGDGQSFGPAWLSDMRIIHAENSPPPAYLVVSKVRAEARTTETVTGERGSRGMTWRTDVMATTMSDAQTDTFLAPIEKPPGLFMKLAYAMTRRQFGKVITPVKVAYSRLPPAFGLFSSKISKLDKKLELPPETAMLIRERVARLNMCLFCIDIGRAFVIQESMNEAKFDALEDYRTSPLFTGAQRAALDYVTELTKDKQVDPNTFQRMAGYYSEREICEIVWLVASEHYYNITNIGLNIHSDMLCDISKQRKSRQKIGA
jgi:alkylhydroperoxidase family enzyme